MHQMPEYPDQPELALVAALTLISRYSCCQSPALAGAAVIQLQAVANDDRFSEELRECAEKLIGFWLQRSADENEMEAGQMLH